MPNTATHTPSKLFIAWTKVSDHLYRHYSGVRIEKRGHPEEPGWYLVYPEPGAEVLRFPPTIQGCDDAFIAFAASNLRRRGT